MEKNQRVLQALKKKPKIASLGFNDKELKGIAAKIADNLKSEEDAKEEDLDAEIDSQIEAALPYLETAQSVANRIVNDKSVKSKKETKKSDDDEDDDYEDNENDIQKESAKNISKKSVQKQSRTRSEEEPPSWFKEYVEKQEKRIEAIEKAKSAESYSKKMAERFKNIDSEFYSVAAEGKQFDSDEDFEAFATKIEEKWDAYSQKLANEGLSRMAKPKGKEENGDGKNQISQELKNRVEAREKEPENTVIRGIPKV